MTKGKIHIYSGEGKGKTTAGIGLAVRAAGQGLNVCIVQFLKGGERGSGEFKLISKRIPEIDFIPAEMSHPIHLKKKPIPSKLEEAAVKAFELAKEKSLGEELDLLILEEINTVIDSNWLSQIDVIDFLENKPPTLEVVLTGKDASPQLQSMAHYVTEMLKIKHPYDDGFVARRGIEY